MTEASPAVLISRRKRRRKIVFRFGIVFFAVLLFLGASFVGLFFVDKFKIKDISVEGNHFLTKEEIRREVESAMSAKILGVIPGDRIFSFSSEKAEGILESRFGRLSFVEIKKKIPAGVEVAVKEREPIALFCVTDSKDCFFVDGQGFVFEEAPFFSSGVYLKFFDGRSKKSGKGQFLIAGENMKRLISFLEKTSPYFNISEAHLNDDGVYKLRTDEGIFLILDESDDWDLLFSNLETFLWGYKDGEYTDFEYIDLRFGNKVFYKIK